METEDDVSEIERVLELMGLDVTYGDAPEWVVALARLIIAGTETYEGPNQTN